MRGDTTNLLCFLLNNNKYNVYLKVEGFIYKFTKLRQGGTKNG